MKPYVSVIVPAYNAGEYIEKCIGSIIAQTYRDQEIIFVDDGSEDNTGKVCDYYAGQHHNVKVIHKDNGGLVSARKTGLKAAAGVFIACVDADDWIEPDYIENMVCIQKASGADIVAAAHFHDIGKDSKRVCNNFSTGIYQKEELLQSLICSGNFFEYGLQPHLWNKLIRKTILEKPQMSVPNEINAGEDAAVLYPSVLDAKKICVTDVCGYHYVQHHGSITKSSSAGEAERLALLYEHLENVFKEKGVGAVFKKQLYFYKKYMFLMRQLDCYEGQYPFPYGENVLGSKAIIYGAGVLGQKLYACMSKQGTDMVVAWVDRNWNAYNESGFAVESPQNIKNYEGKYQYILIANISYTTAQQIKKYLLDLRVVEKKILWFSESFLQYENSV